jgi:hypothetical protein
LGIAEVQPVLLEHYHRSVRKSAAGAFWAITPEMVAAEKIVAIAAAG